MVRLSTASPGDAARHGRRVPAQGVPARYGGTLVGSRRTGRDLYADGQGHRADAHRPRPRLAGAHGQDRTDAGIANPVLRKARPSGTGWAMKITKLETVYFEAQPNEEW